MSTPRRRLIRPDAITLVADESRRQRVQNLRVKLDRAHRAVERWRRRLKRDFSTIARHEKTTLRLERQLAKLENA